MVVTNITNFKVFILSF